jgi:hypothetical protein
MSKIRHTTWEDVHLSRIGQTGGPDWSDRSRYVENLLKVVFLHSFVRVSTFKGERPLLPMNIKGHNRLRGSQSNLFF